jgi:uncharacterized protein (DUF302 family)
MGVSTHSGVAPGFVETKRSPRSVPETVARFVEIATSKGLKIFAVIDQRAEAQQVNLELPETTLVIFGSPTAGTPVMRASPLVALDLPLRILVWSDKGHTTVSYTKPEELAARYQLTDDEVRAFVGIDALTDALVAE